jgi:TorA maturation chaperone TorD
MRNERMKELISPIAADRVVDGIDCARAREYALLATLLSHSPDARMIEQLASLKGDETPLGIAHASLGKAAGRVTEQGAARQYFDLFVGLGQYLLLPYASHYLAGSLYGRPLARLRDALQHLGVEGARASEPEDHIATLCEIMAGLITGDIGTEAGADREFFETHLAPWAGRFFSDLDRAKSADFYAGIGLVGRTFFDAEREAYSLSAKGSAQLQI